MKSATNADAGCAASSEGVPSWTTLPASRDARADGDPELHRSTVLALAERILDFLIREGGPFVADDFARQQCEVYDPIRTTYRDVTVLQTAPVSQGFLMLEQLNILEGFDLATLGHNTDTVADARYLDLVTRGVLYRGEKVEVSLADAIRGRVSHSCNSVANAPQSPESAGSMSK